MEIVMKRTHIEEAEEHWAQNDPLRAGQAIYEHLRREHRPVWAAEILAICRERLPQIPEVEAVIAVVDEPAGWARARGMFDAIRQRTLAAERDPRPDPLLRAVLKLAENTAKVTYNATGLPAPYDHQAGWRIAPHLKTVLELVPDPLFRARVWAAFTCERFSGPAAA